VSILFFHCWKRSSALMGRYCRCHKMTDFWSDHPYGRQRYLLSLADKRGQMAGLGTPHRETTVILSEAAHIPFRGQVEEGA